MGLTRISGTAVAFVSCILSGCANRSVWVKPGATDADFEIAKGHCLGEAYSRVPSAPAVATFGGGYPTPAVTNCTTFGYSANCVTTGGQYTPPISVPYDTNAGARTAVYRGCMYGEGWSLERQNDVAPAADTDWSKGLKWGVKNHEAAACNSPPADITNRSDWSLGCRTGQESH